MEIEFQCQVIINSCNDLAMSIKSDNAIHCWSLIQSILFACTSISKILCPSTPRDKSLIDTFKERSDYLKKKLSINESYYLVSKHLRTDLECLDESLHSWAKGSNNALAHRNIEPHRFMPLNNQSKGSFMANFDPDTFILTLWEKEFPIKDILDESTRLLMRTQNSIRKLNSI
jgi:hypothetical protein